MDQNLTIQYQNRTASKWFGVISSGTTIFEHLQITDNQKSQLQNKLPFNSPIVFELQDQGRKRCNQILLTPKHDTEYIMVVKDITTIKSYDDHIRQGALSEITLMRNCQHEALRRQTDMESALEISKAEFKTHSDQFKNTSDSLVSLLHEMIAYGAKSPLTQQLKFSKIKNQLEKILEGDGSLDYHQFFFRNASPAFIKLLKTKNANLTEHELRHCTFLSMGLTNRQVADILHISPGAVEVAQYRLKKKLNLGKGVRISQYLKELQK